MKKRLQNHFYVKSREMFFRDLPESNEVSEEYDEDFSSICTLHPHFTTLYPVNAALAFAMASAAVASIVAINALNHLSAD